MVRFIGDVVLRGLIGSKWAPLLRSGGHEALQALLNTASTP
jgi:hypothetical protein